VLYLLHSIIGAPAAIMVNKGDYVRMARKLQKAKVLFHPIFILQSREIVNKTDLVTDTSGYKQPAVFIDVEGDEWVETMTK